MSKFKVRAETRLKNYRLVGAREKMKMNVKQFAEFIGITYATYCGYETMRLYPFPKHRKLLAEFCGCNENVLFPPELEQYAKGDEPRVLVQVAEIEPSRLIGRVRRQAMLLPANETADQETEAKEIHEELVRALSTLKEREEMVLRLYFGFDGEDPKTLEEIGEILNVTRSRARQIKDRALARLCNHPWVSRPLHDLFELGVEGVMCDGVLNAARRAREEARERQMRENSEADNSL